MKNKKIGLVGIGNLGTAMMAHWNEHNLAIGIFHPEEIKAENFIKQFPNGYLLSESELSKLDLLILALPAASVIPVISSLKQSTKEHFPCVINMATALHTNEITLKFPFLKIFGVKFMGHARDLLEHGNGLFITESALKEQIEEIFFPLGKIKIDREACLTEVNKLATRIAVKTAIEIETEFAKRGLPHEYVERALKSLAPEVIRSYSEGNLGHFAQEIVEQIQHRKKKDDGPYRG